MVVVLVTAAAAAATVLLLLPCSLSLWRIFVRQRPAHEEAHSALRHTMLFRDCLRLPAEQATCRLDAVSGWAPLNSTVTLLSGLKTPLVLVLAGCLLHITMFMAVEDACSAVGC